MKKEIIVFDHDTPHVTTCTRLRNNRFYYGSTVCGEEDYSMESKLIGEHYAYVRSVIEELQEQRFVKKEQLKILRHVYNINEQSKDFNYRSPENYILRKQMKILHKEIMELKNDTAALQENLKKQMDARDKLHATFEKNREKQNGSEEN